MCLDFTEIYSNPNLNPSRTAENVSEESCKLFIIQSAAMITPSELNQRIHQKVIGDQIEKVKNQIDTYQPTPCVKNHTKLANEICSENKEALQSGSLYIECIETYLLAYCYDFNSFLTQDEYVNVTNT
eukprot:Awhi_evm1s10026